MADYGFGRGGNSLRDALNELYPMTGLGEYGAGFPPTMFPPQTGSPQPSGPVPIPQPRPPMARPQYLPPAGAAVAQGPRLGLPPQWLQGQGQLGAGGLAAGPQSYAARLGLTGAF